MAYQTVTKQGLGRRLGGSIKGVVGGLVLVLLGVGVLFWNEGNFIQTKKALEEGAKVVLPMDEPKLNPNNEGKLIHISGVSTTTDTLSDPQLGVSTSGKIRLARSAEMFQWQENAQSETKEKLGGGTETVTTYTYEKVWSPTLIDSSSFKDPEYVGLNPSSMPFTNESWSASNVTVGDFRLTPAQIERLTKSETLTLTDASLANLPDTLRERMTISGGGFYLGVNPESPAIGDVRIKFSVVPTGDVSIVAVQTGNSFRPYKAATGKNVDLLSEAKQTAEEMFADAKADNEIMTWILRLGGFLAILIGFNFILAPMGVLASVIPPLGALVRFGTGLVAFIIAAPVALVTIAVGWLYYRPFIGVLIIILGVFVPVFLFLFVRKKRLPAQLS